MKQPPIDPAASSAPNPRHAWLLALLLVLGVLAAYHAVGGHGYVAYDDNTYVYENPQVLAGLTSEGLDWALTSTSYGANWHPLTWLSHMLDVELFGADNPGAAHWENVLLHAACACLFFLGLLRMSGRLWASFLGAALFAWHPLRVESVAWISERKDVLSALFLGLTIWSYVNWCRRPNPIAYMGCLISLTLGLMAKPMLVTAPALLFLLDGWPLRRLRSLADLRPRLQEKLPLLLVVLLSAWLTFSAQSSDGVVSSQVPTSVTLANALASIGVYLGQTLWPLDLACIYPLASSVSREPLELLMLPAALGLACLLGISALAWRLRQRFPALLVGWLWYLISLVPVIGIIQVGDQAHADRYTYLPMLGLVAALALGLDALVRRRAALRWPLIALTGVWLVVLLGLSERQSATWRDTHTLFAQALKVDRRNPIALGNAGFAWQQTGDETKARELFEEALRIGPPRLNVQLNLATSYIRLSQLDQARQLLEQINQQHPKEWRVHSNLGELEFRSQNLVAARESYERAIALGSNYFGDQLQLGLIKMGGDPRAAHKHFQEAIRLNPRSAKAYYGLGRLEMSQGNHAGAVPLLQRAVELSEQPPTQLLQALSEAQRHLGG